MNKQESQERVKELIREGKNYSQTKEVILKEGGKIAGATFYRYKQDIFPSEKMDESDLAKIINKGLYHGVFPLCKNKQLKEEDIQDVNVGGSCVACIIYFFPEVDLNNPLIVLTTRGILFYIRFKAICSAVTQKIDELKAKVVGGDSGIKEGWK